MHLLKLDKHEHGNSIYFTRDNMVKSGHIIFYIEHCTAISYYKQASYHFISILPGILCHRSIGRKMAYRYVFGWTFAINIGHGLIQLVCRGGSMISGEGG